jgi:transcriptional regulator with XRE-family HTH domain
MSITKNLKELRLQRKLTQGELAEVAKIELAQISRIERGASEPKLETIKKLSIALQCTADELIMDQSNNKEPEYLKRLLKRINQLSPLKKYVVLNMLQSYLSINEMQEPSISSRINEFGNQYSIEDEELEELSQEHRIVDEITNDIKNQAEILSMEIHNRR